MNMTADTDKVLNEIVVLRKKMITTGIQKGLTHPETIKFSKELDRLINKVLIEQS